MVNKSKQSREINDGPIHIGIRNIDNATFLHKMVMPLLVKEKKWELVAYQCHLNAELLIGGLVELFGGTAKPENGKHNFEALLDKLKEAVDHKKAEYNLILVLFDSEADFGIFVDYDGFRISLTEYWLGRYSSFFYGTGLADFKKISKVEIRHQNKSYYLNLYVGNYIALSREIRAPANSRLRSFKRDFSLKKHSEILGKIKSESSKLLTHEKMMMSRYSKKRVSGHMAKRYLSLVNNIFKLTNDFVSIAEPEIVKGVDFEYPKLMATKQIKKIEGQTETNQEPSNWMVVDSGWTGFENGPYGKNS